MKRVLSLLILMSSVFSALAAGTKQVYVFPIHEQIMPSAAKLTNKCLAEAKAQNADYIIIDINTYGGLVDAADSIRTAILNCPIPVYVFINNQALSAGALISIAADRIYMREGGNIGAATVVNQSGDAMPDKYQSAMRAMMRSTAESHGKVADVVGGDTTWRWVRDPAIAEAMVDPRTAIEGLVDEGKVVTMTTEEAIEWHYCEGKASSVEQILDQAGVTDYQIHRYTPTWLDRLLGFLTNPAFQGVIIMLIIGGIYFELQTPGVGFPLVVAILGAVLYFAPLYLEGLVANWEILVFVVGVLLVLVEIFIIPGFGVTGILGIVAIVLGLAFAMIDTDILRHIPTGEVSVSYILTPLAVVIVSFTAAIILSIWLGRRFLTGDSALKERVVLTLDMSAEDGFVAHKSVESFLGMRATTSTALRPAGKVILDGMTFDAASQYGDFIDKGAPVEVIRAETGVLYCKKVAQ